MNVLKRTLIIITRHPKRTSLLFFIVFFLATMTSLALSITSAIEATEISLRNRLPAITGIRIDDDRLSSMSTEELEDMGLHGISPSQVREIIGLPYVRDYEFITWGRSFYSDTLVLANPPGLYLEGDFESPDQVHWNSLRSQGVDLENFLLKGVANPNVFDIQTGLINLVAGRTFTQEEMENGHKSVIVSKDFAEINNLILGSTFTLTHKMMDLFNTSSSLVEIYSEENLFLSDEFEFKIVGLFEHELIERRPIERHLILEHTEILNHIYIPHTAIEETIVDFFIQGWLEMDPTFLEDLTEEDIMRFFNYENIVFVLEDPSYLPSFHEAARRIIPYHWTSTDLSNAFADISASMENLNEISNLILIGSISATLITLSLLILISLKERQVEMAIYLSLGEKKCKIINQMIMEITLISMIGITLALFAGNLVAGEISREMIRVDLRSQAEAPVESTFIDMRSLEGMGFRQEMSHEEMLATFNVALDGSTTALFYVITLLVILVSSITPAIFIFKIEPRKILLG